MNTSDLTNSEYVSVIPEETALQYVFNFQNQLNSTWNQSSKQQSQQRSPRRLVAEYDLARLSAANKFPSESVYFVDSNVSRNKCLNEDNCNMNNSRMESSAKHISNAKLEQRDDSLRAIRFNQNQAFSTTPPCDTPKGIESAFFHTVNRTAAILSSYAWQHPVEVHLNKEEGPHIPVTSEPTVLSRRFIKGQISDQKEHHLQHLQRQYQQQRQKKQQQQHYDKSDREPDITLPIPMEFPAVHYNTQFSQIGDAFTPVCKKIFSSYEQDDLNELQSLMDVAA